MMGRAEGTEWLSDRSASVPLVLVTVQIHFGEPPSQTSCHLSGASHGSGSARFSPHEILRMVMFGGV